MKTDVEKIKILLSKVDAIISKNKLLSFLSTIPICDILTMSIADPVPYKGKGTVRKVPFPCKCTILERHPADR